MNLEPFFFERIGIAGVGLIGSSFALAMKERKCVKEVWGYSLSGRSAKKAFELGIIDRHISDLSQLARGCNLILVAAPVLSIPKILEALSKDVDENVIVTDGGSVKNFVEECSNYFKYNNFVGSHPIAGTEKSGPEAGFSSLFDGGMCIVTPLKTSSEKHVSLVKRVWEVLGMNVVTMSPDEHDRVMAEVSHMPHAVAFSLVSAVKDKFFQERSVTSFAGGGFRDFTRIAKSDVTMWADIFMSNKKHLLASIEDFKKEIDNFCNLLKNNDREALEAFISAARKILLKN